MASDHIQLSLAEASGSYNYSTPGSVQCLGMTFENDEARRAYFLEKLREKLKDPEFRQIEGFPVGEDKDILALSDPPYYTACPNPFLADFIQYYGKPYDPEKDDYRREPFSADVSEGKNDPIYNAHNYHTKVPHKAIMRYILHYTNPGDIVFDGFCGTGMTGVAAQLCGDKATVESLGYKVTSDGNILDETDTLFSQLGARRVILNDLSPAATFIAYHYNIPVDTTEFEQEAKSILEEIENEFGWLYETWHLDKKTKGRINYTVWSEVFNCPNCGAEIVYYDVAVNQETFQVLNEFKCPQCKKEKLNKKALGRTWETSYDEWLGKPIKSVKYKPVLINYQVGKMRFEKQPDAHDYEILKKINDCPIDDWIPFLIMPEGERKSKDGYHLKGITHLHHFYFRRSLLIYARVWQKTKAIHRQSFVKFFVQSASLGFTKMNRYQPIQFGRTGGSQVNRYFSGTLFVGSLISEVSPSYSMTNKLKRLSRLRMPGITSMALITCQTTTNLDSVCNNSIDYIFVDPPFGNNLHYSELNFHWEAWLNVLTERHPEAVMDKERKRTLLDYQQLMIHAFQECYRILKPGRWLTVEFHNSKNSVWNAIQDAIQQAGFVVADVRTLDKQQETYKQSIQKLVKQDLVISAYKPSEELESRFELEAGTEQGVWDFVQSHLKQIPVFVEKDGQAEVIAERQDYLLYDRMVAFHIQKGVMIPLSAAEFYGGLEQRFEKRVTMYFLPEQAAEYDRKRHTVREFLQLDLLVTDEESAIQWIRQQLTRKPQTLQELTPKFMKEGQRSWAKHERLFELRELLEDNFPCYRGNEILPPQIVSWLKESSTYREIMNGIDAEQFTDAGLETDNLVLLGAAMDRWYVPNPERARDLELIRDQKLLREFEQYCQSKQRKLKQFRTEAIRAGFRKCWQERTEEGYRTIVDIAHKIPETILQEDDKLFRFYNQAITRLGGS